VGIYDHEHIHSEDSMHYDKGFLSNVILHWEGELANISKNNLRVVVLRLGVVLDRGGGMLMQMIYPLKFGIGFGVRSDDFFPFVHLEDLMNVFIFSIERTNIKGVVNVTAPNLTSIEHFFSEVFEVKKGKILIWLSKGFIKLILGDSGSLLTNGQKVIPTKLENEGFVFNYDNIEDALNKACN
jgi:uncharacterized protein